MTIIIMRIIYTDLSGSHQYFILQKCRLYLKDNVSKECLKINTQLPSNTNLDP